MCQRIRVLKIIPLVSLRGMSVLGILNRNTPRNECDMSGDRISTKEHWKDYWASHSVQKVAKFPFESCLSDRLKDNQNEIKVLEIGGFPGSLSASMLGHIPNSRMTILDFCIVEDKVRHVEALYNMPDKAISTIEADMFEAAATPEYEFVCSFGLIEHFGDPAKVIERHLAFCKPGGSLLITYPNMRGINGLIQRRFDPANLAIHNLEIMNLELIRKVLEQIEGAEGSIQFFGRPAVWLEPSAPCSGLVKRMVRVFSGIISRLSFLGGIWWSPHFVIKMKRSCL